MTPIVYRLFAPGLFLLLSALATRNLAGGDASLSHPGGQGLLINVFAGIFAGIVDHTRLFSTWVSINRRKAR